MIRRQLGIGALAAIGLVAGLAAPASAKVPVKVGPTHPVLSSFSPQSVSPLACVPSKAKTPVCYLVGEGPGGTPPAGTTSFPPADYTPEIVPIKGGKAAKPVTLPGSETAETIGCPGGSTCYAAGYSSVSATGTKAAVIPVKNGKPGKPVAVAGSMIWQVETCPSSSMCIVVGARRSSSSEQGVVAVVKHGKVTVHVIAGTEAIEAVSCSSASACVGVGSTTASHGFFVGLKNGKPGKPHALSSTGALVSVACGWTRGVCEARGYDSSSQGVVEVTALIKGSKAHVSTLSSTAPALAYLCPSVGSCVGYGVVNPNTTNQKGIVDHVSKGKSSKTVAVTGSTDVEFLACGKPGACVGAGAQTSGKYGDYSIVTFLAGF